MNNRELATGITTGNFSVKFEFTGDRQEQLVAGIWTASVGIRVIRAELGLEPGVINSDVDVRYYTDDAKIFAELLKILMCYSDGGWFCIEPMPKNINVFHVLHPQGGKYSNE